jgi:hypothetical protein
MMGHSSTHKNLLETATSTKQRSSPAEMTVLPTPMYPVCQILPGVDNRSSSMTKTTEIFSYSCSAVKHQSIANVIL